MNIYQEKLLDHYANPLNYGVLEDADQVIKHANISCGDEVVFYIKYGDKKEIVEVKFTAQACAICIASCSILSNAVKKLKSREKQSNLIKDVASCLKLLEVPLTPSRERCALVAQSALQKALTEPPE